MQEPVVDRALDVFYLAEHPLVSVVLEMSVELRPAVFGPVIVILGHQGSQVVITTLAQQLALKHNNPMSWKYRKHHVDLPR